MGILDILGSPEDMFDAIRRTFDDVGISTSSFTELDHLCYRVSSEAHYEKYRLALTGWAVLVDESLINERPISLFKLREPFFFDGLSISLLELPAPGRTAYTQGWEHAEFVVPSLRHFLAEQLSLRYEMSKLEDAENPTISFHASEFRVKIHEQNILEVITSRQRAMA